MANITQLNTRYYQIAGISLGIHADLPISDNTFEPKFNHFWVDAPVEVILSLNHHFALPEINRSALGNAVYHMLPWAIYRLGSAWLYLGILSEENAPLFRVAIFNDKSTTGHIYSPDAENFLNGNIESLSLLPTDQIWLARVLADRQGCYLHAAGLILDGQGLLFVGHSGAGKSTIVTMLQNEGEILCDDRMIVRRWPEGFRIHGTWSHGEIPVVSPNSAPLRAILLLEQAPHNRLIPMTDRREIVRRLPFFVVKPLVTADWWEKTLDLVGAIAREVPVYRLQFDKSGKVIDVLKSLL